MPTYIEKTTDSDLTPSWPQTTSFDKEISVGTGTDTFVSVTMMAGQFRSGAFITPAGVPNNDAFEDTGAQTVEIEIDTQTANIQARCRVVMLGSTGTILESGGFTGFQTLGAASRSFSPVSPAWSATESCANRLAIEFEFENTAGHGSESADIGLGTASNEIITDISENSGSCGGAAAKFINQGGGDMD